MRGITLVRIAAASMMVIHGSYRAAVGGPPGFGEFLGSWHIPFGTGVAWLLTIAEIVGGGRNGVEYSVLLILCFVAVALDAPPRAAENVGAGRPARQTS